VQAIAFYEGCMKLCPENPNAFQNHLLALNYIHAGDSSLVCEAHAEWGRNFLQQATKPLDPISRNCWPQLSGGRKLRVGYLSPDLYRHSVSYFAEAPLAHHNRDRVEVNPHPLCTQQIRAQDPYLRSQDTHFLLTHLLEPT
jgi:protein O-GlcNAc transferase